MRRVVLLVLTLLIRVDAAAFTRQDLEQIRASKRVEAVPVNQPIRLDGLLVWCGMKRARPALPDERCY